MINCIFWATSVLADRKKHGNTVIASCAGTFTLWKVIMTARFATSKARFVAGVSWPRSESADRESCSVTTQCVSGIILRVASGISTVILTATSKTIRRRCPSMSAWTRMIFNRGTWTRYAPRWNQDGTLASFATERKSGRIPNSINSINRVRLDTYRERLSQPHGHVFVTQYLSSNPSELQVGLWRHRDKQGVKVISRQIYNASGMAE